MTEEIIKYSGYVLFLLGSFFSIWKIRYEIKKKKEYENLASLREKRFATYRNFLSKIDLMNSELYDKQYNQESMNKINDVIENIKNGPANISDYQDFIVFQFQILIEWMKKYNKYLDELNELRLIGSSELINLLDEYQKIVKEYLEANAESMLMYQYNLPGQFDTSVVINYTTKQEQLVEIRKRMEKQMRLDIGNE